MFLGSDCLTLYVAFSVRPSNGNCGVVAQWLLIVIGNFFEASKLSHPRILDGRSKKIENSRKPSHEAK
jgi:hypothetical protein